LQVGKTANGQQTRGIFVEGAAPIFNKREYEGNSLSNPYGGDRLGSYRHFPSKEELAAEAFDYTGKPRGKPGCCMDEKAKA